MTIRSKKTLITITAIVIIIFLFIQKRDIYDLGNNHYVTRWGAYIMPYKYYGLVTPEDNFIKLYNFDGVDLVFIADSNIIIGEHYGDSVLMKFSKYNCKYYNKNEFDEFKKIYYDNSIHFISWHFLDEPIYSNMSGELDRDL